MEEKETPRLSRRKAREEALERLVVAAEDQLREEALDLLTVDRVLERAGVSIGTFYRVFSGRQTLLSAVQDRLRERMEPAILEALKAEADAMESLEEAVYHAFGIVIEHVWEERQLYRAFMLLSAVDPVLRVRFREINLERREAIKTVLLKHRAEVGRPDPDQAIEEAYHMYLTSLHGRLVFLGPGIGPLHHMDDDLFFLQMKISIYNFLRGNADGRAHSGNE